KVKGVGDSSAMDETEAADDGPRAASGSGDSGSGSGSGDSGSALSRAGGPAAFRVGAIDADRLRSAVASRLFGVEAEPVKIGRFTILSRLGAGGMGVVYSAYDDQLDRKLAIK